MRGLGSERLDLGSERPDLVSEGSDLGSERPDLGSEGSDSGSERPDLGSQRFSLESNRSQLFKKSLIVPICKSVILCTFFITLSGLIPFFTAGHTERWSGD